MEEFVTGSVPGPVTDRLLTTVVFVNILGGAGAAGFGDLARAELGWHRGAPGRGGVPAGVAACGHPHGRGRTARRRRRRCGGARRRARRGCRDPGEVWVTRTVRDLVAGSALEFEGRGTRTFSGITEPWELLAAG